MASTHTDKPAYPLIEKLIVIGLILLFLNSGYLVAFTETSILYLINVFLHVALGAVCFALLLHQGYKFLRRETPKGNDIARYFGYSGYWLLMFGMGLGFYLMIVGAGKSHHTALVMHVVVCLLAIVLLIKAIRNIGHQISVANPINSAGRVLMVVAVVAICVPVLAHIYKTIVPSDEIIAENTVPATYSMAESAMGGAQGPFFPSAAATVDEKFIKASALGNSESCGAQGCHPDIYRQWQSSAHNFPAFESLWYKPAITELEASQGKAASNWCAGCHTPALLLSGATAQTPEEQSQLSAAHGSIGCVSCHAIARMKGTTGQANYVMETPGLSELANSENAALRKIYAWFVHLNPRPHRQTYFKPFLADETGKFCSSCHKASVDYPVNQGHWLQVLNDYDSWQSSSFSRETVPEFYRPDKKQDCSMCHMPLVASRDAGSDSGLVRAHFFLGANTLAPVLRQEHEHLEKTQDFLRDNKISLDVFAVSLGWPDTSRQTFLSSNADSVSIIEKRVALSATTINHEDIDQISPAARPLALGTTFIAPLDRQNVRVHPGESVRVDVVVRSRAVGHSFPAGVSDMAEAWLEFKAINDLGQVIFWSGGSTVDLQRVDPYAHRYGAVMVDSTGQRVYHYESWKAHGVAALNLLPPNGVDVVRYRFKIPPNPGNNIQLIAKLHYRKFSSALASVNGQRTGVAIPVIEMAHAEAHLGVEYNLMHRHFYMESYMPEDMSRWNDYGIGLWRQHDLLGAERALLRASQHAPLEHNPWINLGMVWLKSGRLEQAKTTLLHALSLARNSSRAHFFLGLAYKSEGNYSAALDEMKNALDGHQNDRELRIEIGRLYYLMQDYTRAIRAFKKALLVDPEDPTVYFYLRETYRADGDGENAQKMDQLYLKFRQDENMEQLLQQTLTHQPWIEARPREYHEHAVSTPRFWNSIKTNATNGHTEK
ncbi:tetratricopeptide repeat protein [candidate division KSB1 bacterium]|nr:tetratricopeptide repeat protein [candidate division KSB1 bacterium]